MNDKERVSRDRLSVSNSERLLVMSLGLLLTGFAHGFTGDGLGEDCRTASGGTDTSTLPRPDANKCKQLKSPSRSKVRHKDPLGKDLRLRRSDATPSAAAPINGLQNNTEVVNAHDTSAKYSTEKDASNKGATTTALTENTTTENTTTENTTTESATTENTTTENTTTENTTTENATTESATAESATTESATAESATTESATNENATTENATTENATTENATTESATTENTTTDNTTTQNTPVNNATAEDTTTKDTVLKDGKEQAVITEAADGTRGQVGGSAVAPQQSTELFTSDIETDESASGEESSDESRNLFNLGHSSQRTTDDFHSNTDTLSYRNHRRDWFWPWQESASHSLDVGVDVNQTRGGMQGVDFHSYQAQGTLGGYLTQSTYFKAQAGPHALFANSGRRLITSYDATLIFGHGKRFGLQLDRSRDFIYNDAVIGGIANKISAKDSVASFSWQPHQRLRILGSYDLREYEQQTNYSHHSDLSLLYGISPSWPWVWAGVGRERLTYDRQVPDYWSPNLYTAYGLRFDSSFPITKRLSGTAAANLNRIEEDGIKGTGYYLQAGLQYRLYKDLYARLDVNKTKSIQHTSDWTSNNVNFWLSMPLF